MIQNVDFQKTIENAFLKYGASVAQERALPDVRDMLKIGLRQGLYAQFTNKLTHKDKFQKAQKSVAAAMAQSYVHGDAAMYDTFIRAARPWSYRYPIEDVQGSYGNPSSPDSHAAARYVEMRAGEIADYMFAGLKKNAVDEWYLNYDDTEQIPSVFPSIGFWNIVNGCTGIAVALATSVPTFNIREVNEALIKIIKNPEVSYDEIYCAPDFPTGCTIMNGRAVKESLRYGTGESIRMRAQIDYFPDQNMLQVTKLPYMVFTDTIIKQLEELTSNDESYGIEKVTDYTKEVAEIRIYLSKGINVKKLIDKLYKDTSLENYYSVNMILLDQGRFPKVFGWREACNAYINHMRICERNIIQFDLDKALARKNIVDGLIKAYSIIDEIVSLIRASDSPETACKDLITIYGFNEAQAKAILAMKLSSLTKIDIVKLENEAAELAEKIQQYQHLLNDSAALDDELIKVLREVANKFGDERRTKIQNIMESNDENPVQEDDIAIMLFDNNMIRLIKKDEMQGAKRGRKGINLKSPKNSNLINTLYSTNLGTLSAFTDRGRMYTFSLSDLEYGHDYSICEVITIQDNERVILLIDTTSFYAYHYLVTVSKQGYIKKTDTDEYHSHTKKGVTAVKLDDNDELVGVYLSMSNEDKIFIGSNVGYYNYYSLNEISSTGRATKGVKAIKLKENEFVVGAALIKDNLSYKGILSISTSGTGKISSLTDFSETSRAARGAQIMTLKDEQLAAIYGVTKEQEQLFLYTGNRAVTLEVAAIPVQNRATAGIRLIDARGSQSKIEII